MRKFYGPFTRLLTLLSVIFIVQQAWAQTEVATGEAVTTIGESTPSTSPVSESTAVETLKFEALVRELAEGSLPKRAQTVKKIAALNDIRSRVIIEALKDGKLYTNRDEPPIVAIMQNNSASINVLTNKKLSEDIVASLKRVPINNTMRNQLNTLLAQLNINHKDADLRYSAVQRMVSDSLDEDSLALLQTRMATEPSDKVREAITIALAIYNVQSEEVQIRRNAIELLNTSLQPEARTALTFLAENDSDKQVRADAKRALNAIEDRIAAFRLSENIFFGLSLGSVLLLSAIGLAITFGVMGVINMAHGELMMIGAYTTWVVQQVFPNQISYSLLIAVPSAFIVAGLVGIAIERGVIRFLYGRPLETLLATFGISLILQQAARSIFSPLNRAVDLPHWMSGSMVINPVFSITYNRLYILFFGLLVFAVLMAILKKTSLGLKVRAVSQNRAMARAVGVRADWVDAMTFGLGSGIAGIAGVALSQLTNVGPNLGQAYIIDSFMVVVFGGVGNLWGTLVGAMGLGIINKFLEPYAGAVLAKVLVLVLLILFIQKRPKGIFPQKGRAAAD